jgi:hypothetical protein
MQSVSLRELKYCELVSRKTLEKNRDLIGLVYLPRKVCCSSHMHECMLWNMKPCYHARNVELSEFDVTNLPHIEILLPMVLWFVSTSHTGMAFFFFMTSAQYFVGLKLCRHKEKKTNSICKGVVLTTPYSMQI